MSGFFGWWKAGFLCLCITGTLISFIELDPVPRPHELHDDRAFLDSINASMVSCTAEMEERYEIENSSQWLTKLLKDPELSVVFEGHKVVTSVLTSILSEKYLHPSYAVVRKSIEVLQNDTHRKSSMTLADRALIVSALCPTLARVYRS